MKQFVQKGRYFIKNHTHTISFDPNTLDLPPQNAKFHRAQEGGEEFFGGRSTPSEKTASAQLQHTIKRAHQHAHYRSLL
jgi:hypothetical protein